MSVPLLEGPFADAAPASKFARVHAAVRRVPAGRVTTYGRLARAVTAAGYPLSARAAGWALRNCPDDVPWHRVVDAKGALAAELRGTCPPGRQKRLLRREKVPFDRQGRVRLDECVWEPSDSDAFLDPRAQGTSCTAD